MITLHITSVGVKLSYHSIYYYALKLLTNRNEPHNQRYPYSSSDNINAGRGNKYDPLGSKHIYASENKNQQSKSQDNILNQQDGTYRSPGSESSNVAIQDLE
jgi:hypothetical protein